MPTSSQDANFRDALISRILLDEAIEWIAANLQPDEVFNEKTLKAWAEENGYVEGE